MQGQTDPYAALKLENQICFPLYACAKEIVRKYRPFLEAIDLTYTQYIVMMVLWEERQVSCKGLGERLMLDSGTLTPLIKRLKAKGFVTTDRLPQDERIVMVTITEEGMKLREQAKSIPMQMAQCVSLDPDEAMELYRLLYKVLDQLSEE